VGSNITAPVEGSSVVIVGANGSGKTRLGVWLEFEGPQQGQVHRVGAQKSLAFPDSVSPIPLEDAALGLYYGLAKGNANWFKTNQPSDTTKATYKKNNKWLENPAVNMLADFEELVVYLFSDEHRVSTRFRKQALISNVYISPPISLLDQVKEIWESVITHRELIIDEGTVKARPKGEASGNYQASEMSDGERAAFYLIGQCLTRPEGSIIIVDEPEVHLHRAVQISLWNAIEIARPNCLLVYITHDLEFAASRVTAKKIWIKSYNNATWDWREVPSESEGLPEEVLLAVLGSRRPVLFTEGDRGGTEQAIFSHLYPGWTIMPRGGCEQVIQATQAFRALLHLHGIDSHGIVDLDYRSPQEVASLEAVGVHVLNTQEIENLLLVEPVLTLIAAHAHAQSLSADTASNIVQKVKEFAFTALNRDKDLLASRKTAWEMEQQLHKIDRGVMGIAALERVRADAARFDVAATYTAFMQEIERIINSQDYAALLSIYNNKGLARQVGRFFGTLSYPELVKRLINTGQRDDIVQALRVAAPVMHITI
jgi:ABC-type lipoprotein export system ATPase subunit